MAKGKGSKGLTQMRPARLEKSKRAGGSLRIKKKGGRPTGGR